MANWYKKYVLPKLTDVLCSSRPNTLQRQKVVPLASGRVLEVGAGSGLNFAFYDPAQVDRLFALEPAAEMRALAQQKAAVAPVPIELIPGGAEAIPLENDSVDHILITYAMCTIPDLEASFAEFRRVLRPGGRLIFCEHGLAPDPGVRRWQNWLNPLWTQVSGGCNLNRDIPRLITDGGFAIEQLDAMYIPGYKLESYNYWGVAKAR
jgi:ubiquinone/menaquinone biosynthesis C-methylase UbiE